MLLLANACGRTDHNGAPVEPGDDEPQVPGAGSSGVAGRNGGGCGASAGGGSEARGGNGVAIGGSGVGDGGEPPSEEKPSSVILNGHPIYTRVQRLTNAQWERSVRDILRLPETTALAVNFAEPESTSDFTNNERVLFVAAREARDFQSGAERAAELATSTVDALDALDAGAEASEFVETFGRRAFRRPLTAAEQEVYGRAFAFGQTLYGAGFANGAAFVIRAMLQSPHFLYRSELGAPGEPLDGYEIAAKLSFALLGTTPDDDLLDAARDGELETVEGVTRVASAMLETTAARQVMADFHAQLYRFADYAGSMKPGVPEYGPALKAEMLEASSRFFDRLFDTDQAVRDVFASPRAFVGPALALWYGVDAPTELTEMVLPEGRIGFFMQVPFLAATGDDRRSNPFRRTSLLNRAALCFDVSPHATEPSLAPIPAPGQTTREAITEATACGAACHARFFDPLGFAFESFDGMGVARTEDNGLPIDTSGSYPFAEGTQSFSGAAELLQILAESTQAHTCYAKRLASYTLQRDMHENDRPFLEQLSEVSRAESIKGLVLALVQDPAFRVRQGGAP